MPRLRRLELMHVCPDHAWNADASPRDLAVELNRRAAGDARDALQLPSACCTAACWQQGTAGPAFGGVASHTVALRPATPRRPGAQSAPLAVAEHVAGLPGAPVRRSALFTANGLAASHTCKPGGRAIVAALVPPSPLRAIVVVPCMSRASTGRGGPRAAAATVPARAVRARDARRGGASAPSPHGVLSRMYRAIYIYIYIHIYV
jgi:hypothetical protein